MPVIDTIAEPAPTVSIAIGKKIPMHNQGELNRHCQPTYRRIFHRRSAVTAVADVFVQSLVLAGFCPDHAPKQRTRPIHHNISSTGHRAFSTSTKYGFNERSPKASNPVLRNHPIDSRISHIYPKPLSTHAAKSEPEERECHHVDQFISINTNDKILQSTARVPDDMDLEYDRRGTIPQSRNTLQIPPSNVSTPQNQKGRRTNVTPLRPVLRLSIFRGHQIWIIDYNRWLKTTRRRNNKDGPAVKERLQEPTISRNLHLLLPAIEDHTKSNQYVFSLYKRLPSPGISILSVEERAQLLHRFAHPQDRRRSNARYFLSLFNDMIEAGFKLSKSLCTSAIYFTGHKVPRLEKRDLMDAIAIWHRMESTYGLEADDVVFELLYRIATLSGHFAVADRLYQEMKKRGIRLSRRGHVTMLHSYGFRGDVAGIHKTFEELVSSGEVVDTTVLNCLISSLLNAGDLDTAQNIYSRMMQDSAKSLAKAMTAHTKAVLLPSTSTDFAVRRSRSQNLCAIFEDYLEIRKKQGNQDVPDLYVPVVPNVRTFAILFRYHCLSTGDMTAVSQLLDDMENFFESPPKVIIYYFLFRGFGIHTSAKGWTEKLLLGAWDAFKRVLYDSQQRLIDLETSWLPSQSAKPAAIWENPLKSFQIYQTGSQSLPQVLVDDQGREKQSNNEGTENDTVDEGKRSGGVADGTPEEEDIMALFDQLPQTEYGRLHEEWFPEEDTRRRLENGMFLGRDLNIVILKAFGAHCDAETLLRVYADIERMWRPNKRLAVDVNSVRKELHRQLEKVQKREQAIL
ncbi:hypothetical protein ZTR_06204 [Talaromyces verruculosus]|nr:hypothetical protein ZTR_06204 [Talaromyces verruculosus]